VSDTAIDSQAAPARWTKGAPGRMSRLVQSQERDAGGFIVTLDCGHTFAVGQNWLTDGWAEETVVCELEHVVSQRRGGPREELAPRVFEAEEQLRRAKADAPGILKRLDLEIEWFARLIEEEEPRRVQVESYRALLHKLRQVRGDIQPAPGAEMTREGMNAFFAAAQSEPNHQPTRAELAAMLRKLVEVADEMTELVVDERQVHMGEFAEERAAVAEARAMLARIDNAGT
jgi:hypothetical protein